MKKILAHCIKFKKSRPYKPFEQLMTVLPSASSHLLPKQYETLINNNDLRIIEYEKIFSHAKWGR